MRHSPSNAIAFWSTRSQTIRVCYRFSGNLQEKSFDLAWNDFEHADFCNNKPVLCQAVLENASSTLQQREHVPILADYVNDGAVSWLHTRSRPSNVYKRDRTYVKLRPVSLAEPFISSPKTSCVSLIKRAESVSLVVGWHTGGTRLNSVCRNRWATNFEAALLQVCTKTRRRPYLTIGQIALRPENLPTQGRV